MSRYHNATFEQKVNKMEYRTPIEVVNSIYEQGMYISSGRSGKHMEVFKNIGGKSTYVGTLASFVKFNTKCQYRDGDTRNVTLRNIKVR